MKRSRPSRLGAVASSLLLAAAVTAAGGATARAAGVTHRTVYTYYPVRGRTALDLVVHMHTHGTTGTDAFHKAYATLEMSYKVVGKPRQAHGRCRVVGFGMALRFKVTLPRLASPATRNARRLFARFQAFTKRHELRHRSLSLGCIRRGVRRARRLGAMASCEIWIERAGDALVKELTRCSKLHEAFDRREQRRVLKTPLMRVALRQSRTAGRTAARTSHLEREIRKRWNDTR